MNIKKTNQHSEYQSKEAKKLRKYLSVEILMRLLIGHSLLEEWEIIFGNKDPIEIENPISSEQSVLRSNLVGGLLSVVKKNNKGKQTVSIFEFGPTFSHDKKNFTKRSYCSYEVRYDDEKSWVEKDIDVFDIKEDLIEVLKVLDFKENPKIY